MNNIDNMNDTAINNKWVSAWGNAMSITENRPEGYAKNITLRYPIRIPFDGDALRITFDNYCGFEDVTLTKVTVLIGQTFIPVTFNGHTSARIAAKNNIVSDEIKVCVSKEDIATISIFLGEYTQMRSSVFASGPLSKGQYGMGDLTEVYDFDINISRKTNIFYFLSNLSIRTSEANRSIVCYGDSITAQGWPDELALICKNKNFTHTSIVRRATSGSRILREYSCITYESYGLKGTNRFMHEVPTDGADTIIIQQGINDIIHPVGTDVNPFRPMSDLPTTTQLIDGLKWYIEKSRELGLNVYVGTLIPIEGWRTYAPFREIMRNEYNDWIRTTDLIDGCIDFDAALRDTSNPSAFDPKYDSGDHLHPSELGYRTMAQTVPENILW